MLAWHILYRQKQSIFFFFAANISALTLSMWFEHVLQLHRYASSSASVNVAPDFGYM
jgi:hypothetical protein